jgi:hypothetical protein
LQELVWLGAAFDKPRFNPVGSIGDTVRGDHPQQRGVMPSCIGGVGDHQSQRQEREKGGQRKKGQTWSERFLKSF